MLSSESAIQDLVCMSSLEKKERLLLYQSCLAHFADFSSRHITISDHVITLCDFMHFFISFNHDY